MSHSSPSPRLPRRELLAYSAAFGASFVAAQGLGAEQDRQPPAPRPDKSPPAAAPRRYDMQKSINLWAFPYPDKMTLTECFELAKDAGFDAVEPNFNLQGEFSAESTPAEIKAIGAAAKRAGLKISGVCSFLYWPYSLTHNDPARRKQGFELARKMIEAARLLETPNLLTIAGAVYIPWLEDEEPVANDVCDRRSKEAVGRLLPIAEKAGVSLNIENIFANGYLYSPEEMNRYVDHFSSKAIGVHFDTGNIMQYQFPEHWVPMLGKRIRNVHLKEWDKRQKEFNLNTFRPLLDGTTNWPAVIDALDQIGYRGYLTFEYFHPFQHYPEALIYHTSDALDRMLGRRT